MEIFKSRNQRKLRWKISTGPFKPIMLMPLGGLKRLDLV